MIHALTPASKRYFEYSLSRKRMQIALPETKSILLHSCCGPCSSAVLERLSEDFCVYLFFSNSNITNPKEYALRLQTQKDLLAQMPFKNPVTLIEDVYDPEHYAFSVQQGNLYDQEGGERCRLCIGYRMERSAAYAKKNGFAAFTTTLSVSPHKSFPAIRAFGTALMQEKGIYFLDADFKQKGGFLRSTELSKQYNLYRQNYCGCDAASVEQLLQSLGKDHLL